MSAEQTANAKALVAAVARAFYKDDAIVLIDFLIRDNFLKNCNGMGKKLCLSTKKIREVLVFLKKEHIVSIEKVTGIVETRDAKRTYRRSRTAQFWYIDLNRAVHSIRLRLHLIKSDLEKARKDAASSSTYVCPGYTTRVCNGIYTEMEVQNFCIDSTNGLFLCRECHEIHRDNPDTPPHSYVLELVDTKNDFLQAEESLRRLDAQLHSKSFEGMVQRPGIYDLIQRVHECSKGGARQPVTSNLPSENGAEQFVGGGGGDEQETLTFASEAADEFAGLTYFWVDGERVALDIEQTAGHRAASWAVSGGPSEKGQLMCAAQKLATTARHRPLPSSAVLDVVPPPPPQKLACRHRTPEFLRDNTIDWIPKSETLELEDINKLSIGPIVAEDRNDDATAQFARADEEFSQMDQQKFFLDQLKVQMDQLGAPNRSALRKSLSWEKIFLSGSSYASVAWEEGFDSSC